MNSKTSFFNKTLFNADIKRYWWISAVYTLLLVVGCVIPLYNMCLYHSQYYILEFYNWGSFAFAASVIFSLGTGVILFNFMHFNGSVSQIHSLPVKRKTVFITKIVSALSILVIPVIIVGIILAVLSFGEVCEPVTIADIGNFTYVTLAYTLVILSLTVIVNMMTGNPIGTVVFTAGFAFLPLFFMGLFTEIARSEIYGYSQNFAYDILNILYLEPTKLTPDSNGYIYPIMSIVFLLGAYALYRKRKSESHGEVIAFRWLTPVFVAIIAILASGVGYLYADAVFDMNSLLMMLPFGIFGTGIAHMISKKSLDFKGCVKPIIIYSVCALAFCGVIHYDLTGYEKRIPSLDSIESVSVNNHAVYTEPTFTDKEDLQNIVNLHTYLTQNKDSNSYNSSISIIYNLKNGKTLSREYPLDMTRDEAVLKPIYETDEFRKGYFKLIEDGEKEIRYAEISDRRLFEGSIMLYPTGEDMHTLVEAIKEDMRKYPYENFRHDTRPSMSIGIHWERYNQKTDEKLSEYIQFGVHENAVNTIAVLEEIGIYNKLPKAEDIKHVKVTIMDPYSEDKEIVSYTTTDEYKIKELYNAYNDIIDNKKYDRIDNTYNLYVDYTTENGFTFSASCSYDKESIPEMFMLEN